MKFKSKTENDGNNTDHDHYMMTITMIVTLRRPGSIQRTVEEIGERDGTQETQETRPPPLKSIVEQYNF